eukprot:scaffold10.g2383.t1
MRRGKQDLALFADHLVVRTAKDDVAVPYSAIQHVAVLDEIPKDAKGRVLLYLHLSGGGVPHRKGRLAALVVQTTAAAQARACLDIPNPKGNGGRLRDPAAVVLCQALGLVGVAPACFCSPDPEPAMFVPIKDIKSVELARANGTSSTFDLYVHLRDGSTVEFGMIERDEAQRVSAYIRAVRLAVGPPQDSDSEEGGGEEGGSDAGGSEGGANSDSDDPEQDEDFNPYASGGKDAKKGAKKRKRLAAGEEDRTTASRSLGTGTSSSSGSEEEGSNASSGSSEEEGEEEEAEEAGERGGAPHAAAAQDDAASEELGSTSEEEDEDEEEDEEEEEEEEEEEGGSSGGGSGSDSEDDGSAELVDEEGVSVGALAGAMAAEEAAEGGRAAKKQRR